MVCGNDTSREPQPPLLKVLQFCLFDLLSSLFINDIGNIEDEGNDAFFLSIGYLKSSLPVISEIRGFPGSCSFLSVELKGYNCFLQEVVPAPP
jgi:hypothetical protein